MVTYDYSTNQSICNSKEKVDSKKSAWYILPMAFNNCTRFWISPRQEIIMWSVKDRIRRLGTGTTGRDAIIELVAVVAHANFKFYWYVWHLNHICSHKSCVKTIFPSAEKFLKHNLKRELILWSCLPKPLWGHLRL